MYVSTVMNSKALEKDSAKTSPDFRAEFKKPVGERDIKKITDEQVAASEELLLARFDGVLKLLAK